MEILLDVPITFDAADGATHAPMVQADINGTKTLLILDTGSTDHILTTELTGRLGLELEEGEEGTDSSGASVRSWLLGEATVTVADRAFALRDLVVIDPPPPFTAGGIGGALSPQHLDPTAWAVLDLVTDRFRLMEATEGLQPWLSATLPELVPIELEPAGGDGVLLVRAGIDAHDPVVTMIDTGARATQWAADAVPGLETGPRTSAGRGVGGTETFGSEATARTLAVGGARMPLARLIVGQGHGDARGLIGMDVMRGSVLAISPAMRSVVWLVLPDRIGEMLD